MFGKTIRLKSEFDIDSYITPFPSWNELSFKDLLKNSSNYTSEFRFENLDVPGFPIMTEELLKKLLEPKEYSSGRTGAKVKDEASRFKIVGGKFVKSNSGNITKTDDEIFVNYLEQKLYFGLAKRGHSVANIVKKNSLWGVENLGTNSLKTEFMYCKSLSENNLEDYAQFVLNIFSDFVLSSIRIDNDLDNILSDFDKKMLEEVRFRKIQNRTGVNFSKDKLFSYEIASKVHGSLKKDLWAFEKIAEDMDSLIKLNPTYASDRNPRNAFVVDENNSKKIKHVDFNRVKKSSPIISLYGMIDAFTPSYGWASIPANILEFDLDGDIYRQTSIFNTDQKTLFFSKALNLFVGDSYDLKDPEVVSLFGKARAVSSVYFAYESVEKLGKANNYEEMYLYRLEAEHHICIARSELSALFEKGFDNSAYILLDDKLKTTANVIKSIVPEKVQYVAERFMCGDL